MPPRTVQILLLASLSLALLLQWDLLPVEMLGEAAKILLLWSLASTLLVASLGAWIAWRRLASERAAALRGGRTARG
jgi:ABC-type nickel/cobalt efflux system permease component RcnA